MAGSPPLDYSMVFTQIGAGILGLTPLVPWRAVGKGYYLMNLGIALGLLPVAWLFRAAAQGDGWPAFGTDADGLATSLFLAHGLLALAATAVFLTGPGRVGAALTAAAAAAGWLGVLADGVRAAGMAPGNGGLPSPAASAPLLALNYLAGAGLLGGVLGAMLLGHWYLVAKDLPVGPLRTITILLFVFLGARIGLVGMAWMLDPQGAGRISLVPLVVRGLFGLGAPLAMSWMIWGTVSIRSTQAATGILYGVCIFVLMGEAAARFVLLQRGFPL
jgi:hypothetical protein